MKRLLLIALLFNINFLWASPRGDGETRTATVTTKVTSTDLINIQSKYTNLVVESWDRNEVEVVATLRFDGKMTNKMMDFLSEFQKHVEDNIRYSAGELIIDTNLDEPNKFQLGSDHVGIVIGFSEKELRLDYRIKAPAGNEYAINNSYRDVRLVGNFEEMDIKQYSGDLKAGTVNKLNLNLKYGSASFDRVNDAEADIYEQELSITHVGELKLKAKYSDLEFDSFNELDVDAYESDFTLEAGERLTGQLKYGEINVDESLQEASLTLYEVDIEAKELNTLELENSKYSKFDIDKANRVHFIQSYEDNTKFDQLGTFKSSNSKYGKHQIGTLLQTLKLNAYEDEVEIESLGQQASSISIDGKYIDLSLDLGSKYFILTSNVKYGKVSYDESAVNVRKYIKESDRLELEVHSKTSGAGSPMEISIKGYEVDVTLD